MSAQTTITLLRLIHIVAGVFWAGTVFVIAGFLIPSIKETGLEGARFMEHLMMRRKLGAFMGLSAGLAILAGFGLYGYSSAGTHGMWQGSRAGITYGIGGVCAVIAAVVGGAIIQPTAKRLSTIVQHINAADGPPSAEQLAQMQTLQRRIGVLARVVATLLLITVPAMAVARYL